MKKLFWEEGKTNWIGIYVKFLQSIQKKNKKTVFFANYNIIKEASETPTDYSSTIWIFFQLTQ